MCSTPLYGADFDGNEMNMQYILFCIQLIKLAGVNEQNTLSNLPPTCASSWTFGAYTPWAPSSAPQPSAPKEVLHQALTLQAVLGARHPQLLPGGHRRQRLIPPWISPQQQGGTWITPNTLKPLVSPYDPSAVQPILWPGDGAVGFRDIQKDGKTVQSHQH
jgi:hypothetical protein